MYSIEFLTLGIQGQRRVDRPGRRGQQYHNMSILSLRRSGFDSCPRSLAILHKDGKTAYGQYCMGSKGQMSWVFSLRTIQMKRLHSSLDCYLQVTMLFGFVDLTYLTIHGHSFLFCDYSFLFYLQFEMLIGFIFTVHHLLRQLDAIIIVLLRFIFAVANRA